MVIPVDVRYKSRRTEGSGPGTFSIVHFHHSGVKETFWKIDLAFLGTIFVEREVGD